MLWWVLSSFKFTSMVCACLLHKRTLTPHYQRNYISFKTTQNLPIQKHIYCINISLFCFCIDFKDKQFAYITASLQFTFKYYPLLKTSQTIWGFQLICLYLQIACVCMAQGVIYALVGCFALKKLGTFAVFFFPFSFVLVLSNPW